MLVRVISPYFVAGIVLQDDIVVRAAPILGWAIGKQRASVSAIFARKGWKASIL